MFQTQVKSSLAHENDKEAKYYAETFVAQNKESFLKKLEQDVSG